MTRQFSKFFNSIQAKLTILFVIAIIVIMAFITGFNQSIRGLALDAANTSLQIQAQQIANQIDAFNDRNLQTFAVASSLPALIDFFEADAATRQNPALRERVRASMGTLQIYPYDEFNVSSFALLDLEGNNLIDTFPSYEGEYEGDQDYTRQPLISGTPFISTVLFERQRGGAFFYYSVPVRLPEAPTPIVGILRAQVSVSVLQNIILDADFETSPHIVLVDENMIRLVDNQYRDLNFRAIVDYDVTSAQLLRGLSQIPPVSHSQLSVPLPGLVPVIRAKEQTIINGSLHHDSQEAERIAIIPLETVPYTILFAQHAVDFFAPIQRQTQGTWLLSFSLIIGSVGVAVLFSRSLSRPLQELTHIAQLAEDGKLDMRAKIVSNDEIGTLAKAFNSMMAELKQTKDTLEDRVAERTRELSKANTQLVAEIQERERLENQNLQLALESERARLLAEFIQNVSHEFKTPLSVINVQSHLIAKSAGDDEKLLGRVARINNQSKDIERLLNEMVMMSKLDGNSFEFHLEEIRIAQFMDILSLREAPLFEGSDHDLLVTHDTGDALVRGNSGLFSDAMRCLLDNARRFSPAGGTIEITAHQEYEQVVIRIKDPGIGIAGDDLERVFERFYRVDDARTTRGFGLGLPIAKRIIERMNGRIKIESEIGRGTSVIVTLPTTVAVQEKPVSNGNL